MWRLDQALEVARVDQMVAAVIKASGRFKNADGSQVEVPNPRQIRIEFDQRLEAPLDVERQRAALLAEVRR